MNPNTFRYWLREGFIKPKKVKLNKKRINHYPQELIEKINLMFWFCSFQGVKPQIAAKRAGRLIQLHKAIRDGNAHRITIKVDMSDAPVTALKVLDCLAIQVGVNFIDYGSFEDYVSYN